jgi:two-component system, NtrC family, sensor kinase
LGTLLILNRSIEHQTTLAQLKTAQTKPVQTEKMSSLGQLVAGIAHEINNPINFIHGNLDYSATYCKELLELVDLYQEAYPQPQRQIQAKVTGAFPISY